MKDQSKASFEQGFRKPKQAKKCIRFYSYYINDIVLDHLDTGCQCNIG